MPETFSQKSFSPIQSEIFASQKQSHPEFKDNTITITTLTHHSHFLKDETMLE